MKGKSIVLSLALGMSLIGCKKAEKKVEIKTEEDKTFYTIGSMLGQRLATLGLNDQEIGAVTKGIVDAAKGKEPLVAVRDYQPKVQELFRERMKKQSSKTKEDGKKFLESFVSKEGAQKTASGLAYKILKAGTGKKPTATDTVEVHYHGTLIDGTVFDSSVDRKKTVSFPLNRVIKGWTEGLQLIGEGGKIRLVIPAELAYGDSGAPPKIPGGATLNFEVELFKVMAPQAAPAPKAAPKAAPKKAAPKAAAPAKK